MIFDRLENAELYTPLHPGFAPAFAYLRTADFTGLEQGRHEVDGERLFVMLGREPGQGRERRKLEFHERYIDIQCVLSGSDEIGWRSSENCRELDQPYDPKREVGFYKERPETYFTVGEREFAIFYPTDPHAPLSGSGPMLKAVMKVLIDWK
ncbi:MAG: YhcH/YjgK/YiaL family protein [Planctomycetia bacterium]|nr:YhcH/YjgK/YiaL family protein [Planctomycetia bacterium]